MKELLVGMYNPDAPLYLVNEHWRLKLQDLVTRMTTTFQMAMPAPFPAPPLPGAVVPVPPATHNGATLRIFLAPEFFFRKNRNLASAGKRTTAYSESEWKELRASIVQCSSLFPNLLLIAGSVFWKPSYAGRLIMKAVNYRKAPIRNTVVIAHAGTEIRLYDKRTDCSELEDFETRLGYVFQPGTAHGMFQCDGLQCGVETCIDHANGQLQQDGAANLDLHIIVSNTVSVIPGNVCAHQFGFLLYCNATPLNSTFGRDVFIDPFGNNDRNPHSTSNNGCSLFRLTLP